MTEQNASKTNQEGLMGWWDSLDWRVLLILAIPLALAPFFPEPHLWQKLKMLADGSLHQPIDIFDLFMHGSGIILLAIKLVTMVIPRKK